MLNKTFDYDRLRDLTIGTVESVSPSEIKILLEINAPLNTAINNGVPTLFPKINGFLLIPNESGALVGIISWMGVEYSQYPKRKGFNDFDVIDLPYPLRKIFLNPLGTLKQKEDAYELERGVYSFPSVGDVAVIPTSEQLRSIVENREKGAIVNIGSAPFAANAQININPDKLFGRHLAVLGNTGSGKSCSVAGLIRWSLEAAKEIVDERNNQLQDDQKKNLNARFIILDPNGEYSKAFDNIDKPVRKYKVKLTDEGAEENTNQLKVPAWMWNSHEWINFSQAAPGAQQPLLLQSLTDLRRGASVGDSNLRRVVNFLITSKNLLQTYLSNLPTPTNAAQFIGMCKSLENVLEDAEFYKQMIEIEKPALGASLNSVYSNINDTLTRRRWSPGRYNAFSNRDLENIRITFEQILTTPNVNNILIDSIDPDTPLFFNIDQLTGYLEQVAENIGGNILQFVQMLSLRMRFLISDERLKSVVNPENNITLVEWLNDYIGENNAENGQISVIDLSLIPSDVVHIIVSVLTRLTFEATQRYRRLNQKELPTVIVLEEAHTFIRDRSFDESNNSQLCREVFERVAREGRKFGLSIVLSSQRPSELSPTVLSQCNTFLLHRLVNDRDQELVRRLVPDNIGGLLNELPVLPTQKAILLGWASPIPTLVELRELAIEHRPRSNDPKFLDVWTGVEERTIDWDAIAKEWQGESVVEPFVIEEQNIGEEVEPSVDTQEGNPQQEGGEPTQNDDLPF